MCGCVTYFFKYLVKESSLVSELLALKNKNLTGYMVIHYMAVQTPVSIGNTLYDCSNENFN